MAAREEPRYDVPSQLGSSGGRRTPDRHRNQIARLRRISVTAALDRRPHRNLLRPLGEELILRLALALTLSAFCARLSALGLWPPLEPPHLASAPGDTSCVAALDSLVNVLRHDYPGYRDRVVGHEERFTALVDSVRRVATTPAADASYDVCIPALWRITRFFHDAHLSLWQGPARPDAAPSNGRSATATAESAVESPITADGPDRPTLRRYGERALVVRLPDLDMRYKSAVDSLVAKHYAELTDTPTLVIDLRGDAGGCTCTFDALLPLIATGPIRGDGLEVWTSPANIAYFRAVASAPDTPDTLKAEIWRLLPRLEVAPNTFVPIDSATYAYTPPRVLPQPSAVAMLVDSVCASSCEGFISAAHQSRKVTVFSATNTAGAGDYGNIRPVMLPGWRHLRVATSRSPRLRAGIQAATDFVGLAPDVRLPRDSAIGDAAVAFALHHLRAPEM